MAVEGHLHKIVLGGSLAGTETWSISLHYLKVDAGTMAIDGAMTNACNTWFTDPNSQTNSLARLDFIKANELDPLPRINAPDPKTGLPRPASPAFTRYLAAGGVNAVFLSPGTIPHVSANPGLPQATVAMSLTTALARGLAHQGRVYPPTCVAVQADGRMAADLSTQMMSSFKTLILALNAANAGKVVIFSGVRGLWWQQVLGVKCGRVVDTQRRRRRNLIESYGLLSVV